jgi:hypothetical protein
MGLDMYLYCNSRTLTKEIVDESIRDGYAQEFDRWYARSGIIGYWRKESAIHGWFVKNVQDGNDDCGTYEVSYDDLVALRNLCERVIDASELVPGRLIDYWRLEGGKRKPHYVDGKVIKDASVAEALLPKQDGFFFGEAGYDEWYLQGVAYTKWLVDAITSRVHHPNVRTTSIEGVSLAGRTYDLEMASQRYTDENGKTPYGILSSMNYVIDGEEDWDVSLQYHSSW